VLIVSGRTFLESQILCCCCDKLSKHSKISVIEQYLTGPSEFEKFLESEGVKRTFYECVLQGMSHSSAMLIEDGDEMPENSEAGMYENGGHMLFVIY